MGRGVGGSTWKTEQCKEWSHKDSENRKFMELSQKFYKSPAVVPGATAISHTLIGFIWIYTGF